MIGKILSQLLWSPMENSEGADNLMEFEEEGWVIVNLPENEEVSTPSMDPLENLLIEHPSMSVYQMRCRMGDEEEEEEENDDDAARPVAVRRHISWHLAAWGVPLPCNVQLVAVQRAERKKLSRSALHRQNLVKARFSAGEKRYGFFKQPAQRLYCN